MKSTEEIKKSEDLSDFEKLIMKWTTFDYFCPSIKAEVIWDMMLSEFISDMTAFYYNKNREKTGKEYRPEDFYLLAKEFPIRSKNGDKSRRSAKIDYLVAYNAPDPKDNKIIIIELKSTMESFSEPQYNRYSSCKADKMFEFYKELIKENTGKSIYGKAPAYCKKSNKYVSQIAYMYQQFGRHCGEISDMPQEACEIKEFYLRFIDRLAGKYKKTEVIYLYVGNNKSDKNGKDTHLTIWMEKPASEQENPKDKVFFISDTQEREGEFFNYIKSGYFQKKEGQINKLRAWKTLCRLLEYMETKGKQRFVSQKEN